MATYNVYFTADNQELGRCITVCTLNSPSAVKALKRACALYREGGEPQYTLPGDTRLLGYLSYAHKRPMAAGCIKAPRLPKLNGQRGTFFVSDSYKG